MRKVKIKDSYLDVICPLVSGVGKDIDGMSSLHVYCDTDCAWFHIDENCKCEHEDNPKEHVFKKFAYCKDHCIGEIVE